MCSDAAYNVRCADMTDAADAEAYQRAIESQDRMLRPSLSGDAPDRTLSVRWATTATVTVLVATLSEAPATVVGTLEMIGPLEASGALPRRCLLRDVWVDEAHRRRGVARLLMQAAEEQVCQQQVSFLSLEVLGSNEPALALYESLGFAEVEGERSALQRAVVSALPRWMRETIIYGKQVEPAAPAPEGAPRQPAPSRLGSPRASAPDEEEEGEEEQAAEAAAAESARAAKGFFAAYRDEELQALWDLHSATYGDTSAPADEASAGAGPGGLGGLHEAILRTLEEDSPATTPEEGIGA